MAMHGSVSRYVAGCRCWECRIGRSKWDFARRQAVADGRPFSTTGEVSAERVQLFLDAGFTFKAIGRPIGMDVATLSRIVQDPQAMMLRSTEDRILGLKFSEVEEGYAPAIGVTRRLRDLTLLGWTSSAISRHSGVHSNTVRRILFMETKWVNRATAKRLKETFEELSRKTAPDNHWSRTAIRRAEARGWRRAAHYKNLDSKVVYGWERSPTALAAGKVSP